MPCNPEEYLSSQYGENNWKKPLKNDYFNHNSIKYYKDWSDKEWPRVIKWYNIYTGEVDVNKTLYNLNRFSKFEIKLTDLN